MKLHSIGVIPPVDSQKKFNLAQQAQVAQDAAVVAKTQPATASIPSQPVADTVEISAGK